MTSTEGSYMIHSNSPVRPTGRPQCRVVMLAAVVVGNWACSLPAIPSPSSRRSSGEESAYRSSRLQPKPSRMTSSNAGRGGSRPASYSDNVTFAPVTARHVRGVRGQAGHRPGRPRDVGAGPHVAGPGASADRGVTGAYGRGPARGCHARPMVARRSVLDGWKRSLNGPWTIARGRLRRGARWRKNDLGCENLPRTSVGLVLAYPLRAGPAIVDEQTDKTMTPIGQHRPAEPRVYWPV